MGECKMKIEMIHFRRRRKRAFWEKLERCAFSGWQKSEHLIYGNIGLGNFWGKFSTDCNNIVIFLLNKFNKCRKVGDKKIR